MVHINNQMIRGCRHRLEWPFFGLTATLTVLAFAIALSIAFFREVTVAYVEHSLVESYRQDHQGAKGLSDTDVVEKLAQDDKDLINTIKDLSLPIVLLFPLSLLLLLTYQIGRLYGGLRANGVKIGPHQFGQVYAVWEEMARALGFQKIPDLYVTNGNGALNAFATCIPGYRRFGAIYSDILERALVNNDQEVLRFVLGHELGHIRFGHVYWWYFLLSFAGSFPGIVFMVGLPLSRAREYGCDKIGLHLAGDRDCKGLMMLAAGKHLYQQVNLSHYEAEHIHRRSIWDVICNFFSDHPNINWRIAAIRQRRHGDLFWAKAYKSPNVSSESVGAAET